MLRAPGKKFWKLSGQEKRLRRQIKTAQRNVARTDREVRRTGVLTPVAITAQRRARLELELEAGVQHVSWKDFEKAFLAWIHGHLKSSSLRKYEFVLHRFGGLSVQLAYSGDSSRLGSAGGGAFGGPFPSASRSCGGGRGAASGQRRRGARARCHLGPTSSSAAR
jgi:hypothetical protein